MSDLESSSSIPASTSTPASTVPSSPALAGAAREAARETARETAWNRFDVPLIGREAELMQAKGALVGRSVVTIVGLGGIGKTRLAAQLAQDLEAQFADGVCWLNLSAVESHHDWQLALAQALGLSLNPDQLTPGHLAAYLRAHHFLVVLDGFETLIDQVSWLTELQAQAENERSRWLITSREKLNLPGEHVIELRGLSTAPKDEAAGAPLSAAEELFVYHAGRAKPGYMMTPAERAHVRQISVLVNGTPLAIELAAAWVALLPTDFIAEQIQHNLDWLTTSIGLTHSLQRSMRAALDYFWGLLSASEQRCLRQLAVFRDGFDRELAQEVTDASPFFFMALVDRAFLLREASGRYRLHRMLRQYAEEQLNQHPGEANAVRQRHARAIHKLLVRANDEWAWQNEREWLRRLDREHANLRAALQWAIAHSSADLSLQMAILMRWFWQQRGYFAEGIRLIGAVLALIPQLSSANHFKALLAMAEMQLAHGDFEIAQTQAKQVLQQMSPEQPERNLMRSRAYYLLAEVASRQGDHLNALTYAEDSVDAARLAQDPVILARALQCQGRTYKANSNYKQASLAYQEALILHQERRNLLGVADIHTDLGSVNLLQKEMAAATRAFTQAHSLYEQLGDRVNAAHSLMKLGALAYEERSYAKARQQVESALAVFKETGAQEYAVQAMLLLGNVLLEQGQNAEPSILLGLDGALRLGLMPRMLSGLCGVARARMKSGKSASAVELVGLVLSHVAGNSDTVQEANVLLAQLRRVLPHNETERHLASGQRRNLHQTVREILAEADIVK